MFNPKNKNIVLVLHYNPDPDALASMIIIRSILSEKNKDLKFFIVTDYNFKIPFPKLLQINDPIINNSEIPEGSTAYIIDHSDRNYSLLRNWKHHNISDIVIIDHHYDYNQDLTNVKKLIDTNVGSCCELLYDFITANNLIKITKHIATTLYIGIFSDSLYFQTPLKEKQILTIADLVSKYGAEVDKHSLYYRGKYFIHKKKLAEIIFLCCNKLKTSSTVSAVITCERLARLKDNYIGVKTIVAELLNTREVNHVIIRFECKPGLWSIAIASNDQKRIERLITAPQKPKQHYIQNLSKEDAKNKHKRIQKLLEKYEEEYSLDWWDIFKEGNEENGYN